MEPESKLQENTPKKITLGKFRENSENKLFHCGVIEYLEMLFNYKVNNSVLSVFTVLGAVIWKALVDNSNNNLSP